MFHTHCGNKDFNAFGGQKAEAHMEILRMDYHRHKAIASL